MLFHLISITVSLSWVIYYKSTLNQPQSTVDVNGISHYNPYRSTIIHKSYTHPYKPLTDSHALSYTHSHILFQSPSTHSYFSRTFIPFLGFFPCRPPPFYVAPLAFLTLSLLRSHIHIHTQTHTVILSLSHRGTLIKLGWSLMLSPRQQSPWRGWLFQKKKKKTCAFYSHTTCSMPFAHTGHTNMTHKHARAIRQTKRFHWMPGRPVAQPRDEYRRARYIAEELYNFIHEFSGFLCNHLQPFCGCVSVCVDVGICLSGENPACLLLIN